MSGFEINAVRLKKKKGGRIGREINGIASLKPVLPKGTGNDICPPVKVSLAIERDSFTFLSNLVRTSPACLIEAPHRKSVKHVRGETGVTSEAQGTLGQNVLGSNGYLGGCVVSGWAMEGDLASHGTLSAS